jgi:hypothetical protein
MLKKFFKDVVAPIAITGALVFAPASAIAGDGFHQEDLRNKSTEFVQGLATSYSKEKLSFLVHVGEEKLASAVYQVASYLDGQGDDVAYFMAPDIDENPDTTYVEIIKNGVAYSLIGFSGVDVKTFQKAVFDEATKAKNHVALSSIEKSKEDPQPLIAGIAYNN